MPLSQPKKLRAAGRLGLSACALALLCGLGLPSAAAGQSRSSQGANSETAEPAVTAQDSLGQLARQERAARASLARARVYTNRSIPAQGAVSSPGSVANEPAEAESGPGAEAAADARAATEKAWRKRFADARAQLSLDQQNLSVSQREQNLNAQQYYSNPNEAMQQQYSRSDLTQGAQKITDLKAKIAADQQNLSNLTEQLREANLPASWAQ